MIVWPGLRRSVSAISRLFNGASFSAPLTHSAIPTRAASGTTATFTRATTSTWPNNDGYMVTGLAGEIGFVGARRVRNLITGSSENLTNAAWTKDAGVTATFGFTDPLGTTRASKLVMVGAAKRAYNSAAAGSGTTYTGFEYFWLKGDVGGEEVQIGDQANLYTVTLTTEWAQYQSTLRTVTSGFPQIRSVDAGTTTIYATFVQRQDVTAQTTQTAGEYVSVGVASSPYYHGSMVDGVKCFATDINGAAIPSTTLLGYSAEGARTNLCLQSQTFGTTWSPNVTTVSSNAAVAPDGTTTADLVYPNSTGVNRYIGQSGLTTTAATWTFSFYAKYAGAGGWAYCIDLTGSSVVAYFDIQNGAVGTVSAGHSASIEDAGNGWYRCSLITTTAPAGAANVYIGNADANGATTITANGTNGIYLWGAQLELGSFASSYIPTTTLAVARNADVLTYPSSGNIDGTKGWCYAEVTLNAINSSTNNWMVMRDNANGIIYSNGVDGQAVIYDGANGAIKSGLGTFVNTQTKLASTWGGSTQSVTGDGLAPASSVFDGNLNITSTIDIGANSTGNLWGTIRNLRIGQRQLSSSELQAITA